MVTDSGAGPWDNYRQWLSVPIGEAADELTVTGRKIPPDDHPEFGELGWLIRGYQDALIALALLGSRADDGDDTNAFLSRQLQKASEVLTIGDLDVAITGRELASICGAIGLLRIDEFVASLDSNVNGVELVLLWEQVADAHCEAVGAYRDGVEFRDTTVKRRLAQDAANARHRCSPQSKAKDFIRDCWVAWRSQPDQYPGPTAFARSMLEKFPDVLKSQDVVMRWVRMWDQEIAD